MAAVEPASRAKPANRSSSVRNFTNGAATARDRARSTDAVTLPLPAPLANGRRELTNHTTAMAPTPAAGPATAREACGSRQFIALAVCMDRECERPQYRDTQECVPILNTKRQRSER